VVSGLDALRQEARSFKSQSLAASTKRSYYSQLLTYLRFCYFYGLVPAPASQDTITCYIAHLARTLAPKSVNIYLNVVRILHEESGLTNPLLKNYEVNMIKRGILRVKGLPVKQKAPITIEILLLLHGKVNFALNSEKAFWCAMLLGFFGFLRKSSLIPASADVPRGKRLCRSDVRELSLAGFVLVCRHSKSNQFGQYIHSIPYSVCVDKRLCPVFALMCHLGSGLLSPDAPLFNYVQGPGEVFYSHAMFVARLKLGVQACGLDPGRVSCHSLRRGGATFSFECGLTTEQIKSRGDWRSDCYQEYLVISDASHRTVASKLSSFAASRSVLF
jgi:hypothetical protein